MRQRYVSARTAILEALHKVLRESLPPRGQTVKHFVKASVIKQKKIFKVGNTEGTDGTFCTSL